MFSRLWRSLNSFFSLFINRATTVNNEPVNKVSLIVIIIVDIFILGYVFTGLQDISDWHISPSNAYPCYQEWSNYKDSKSIPLDRQFNITKLAISGDRSPKINSKQQYLDLEKDHLGKVSETCLSYAELQDRANTPANQNIIQNISDKSNSISILEETNRGVRSQYDSTLLEKIANQPQTNSINKVSAEKAKQEIDQNNLKISQLNQEITTLKNQFLKTSEALLLIQFIDDSSKFQSVKSGYDNASFWYPSIQIGFQSLFLLPLIAIALAIHNYSNRRNFGLVSLITWHLLVIFTIPLLLKIFEFLQVGVIFTFIFNIISALFGNLLFLISYVYILIIPLVGFLIIKIFQKITSNPKGKVITRVQKTQCVRCAKKIRLHDLHCPYCGFEQYIECQNCQTSTYKYLPYCKQCGHQHSD